MPRHPDTRLIHAGEPDPAIEGAVVPPLFQTAMYEFPEGADPSQLRYVRYGNTPNHAIVEAKLADLAGTEAGLVTASGMAAISSAVVSVLSAGERLLAVGGLYGGTHGLFRDRLPSLGIEVDFVPAKDPEAWREALRPGTGAVYVETITNPLMEVADLSAVAALAREHGLVSMIDNTFATPINFRPVEHGFDLSLHSATKYLNGHSDLVAGAVLGPAALVAGARKAMKDLGGALDPHACFLLHRGLRTLGVRVERQNATALLLAEALEAHPAVDRVHYPGLASHGAHARARALFDDYGGMLSFEPAGGSEAASRFLRAVRIPVVAPSLGGVESLVTRPATSSHAGLSPGERAELGISDALVRVSVGIEHAVDLLEDFERALER